MIKFNIFTLCWTETNHRNSPFPQDCEKATHGCAGHRAIPDLLAASPLLELASCSAISCLLLQFICPRLLFFWSWWQHEVPTQAESLSERCSLCPHWHKNSLVAKIAFSFSWWTVWGSWQAPVPSGAIPAKSQNFCAGLAALRGRLSQAGDTNTKWWWSQKRFLPCKCQAADRFLPQGWCGSSSCYALLQPF